MAPEASASGAYTVSRVLRPRSASCNIICSATPIVEVKVAGECFVVDGNCWARSESVVKDEAEAQLIHRETAWPWRGRK
jgi:hypothetical protein